jgi:FkbM family methyltransferase
MVCIDIGSNIGYYVLLESRVVGDSGKVIAIEPSPKNFNYLRINLVQQKAFNVEPKNFAIGDSNGEIEFLISDRSNYCRVATHGQMEFDTIEKIIKIQAKRLDSFLEENPLEKLDFIRMDVEGYESNIYEGMKNTVSIFRPMLLIEVHKIYLGVEGTKKFLLELKNDGYEINYYIPREMDVPLMGSMKDVQKISIDELIRRLEEDFVSDNFHLFLVNHRR